MLARISTHYIRCYNLWMFNFSMMRGGSDNDDDDDERSFALETSYNKIPAPKLIGETKVPKQNRLHCADRSRWWCEMVLACKFTFFLTPAIINISPGVLMMNEKLATENDKTYINASLTFCKKTNTCRRRWWWHSYKKKLRYNLYRSMIYPWYCTYPP